MSTLLIVDDEAAIQHAFIRAFRDEGINLTRASRADEAADVFTRERPDVVLLDIKLPDASGLETFQRLKAIDARVPIILITGHGTSELAIEAMMHGAYEYLVKPLELEEIRKTVSRAVRSSQMMRVPASLPQSAETDAPGDLLIGRCAAMQEVYKAIGRVAGQTVTVLLRGQSGTGKELIARAIYQHSARATKPFLAINCAAIPETLLESELFGHERGAFTGADRKRVGKFEQCHGGTLFLDEVGEMSPLTQAKMLRVIQEQRFERVGGTETVQTDVRLIAATNADLETLVEEGKFRRDLYFRLNVFSIVLPPLRERGSDLRMLVEHYLGRFSKELGKPVAGVAPDAMAILESYSWPGNVRELQSVLKQAVLQMRGTVLLADFLPIRAEGESFIEPSEFFDWDAFVRQRLEAGTRELYAEALERMEREILIRVLRHTAGNQVQAAQVLGITRGSLRNKIRTLGIRLGRSVSTEEGDQG